MTAMPTRGRPVEEVRAELSARQAEDLDWHSGKVLSGLYHPGDGPGDLAAEAYLRYLTPNALYVNFYPSINRLEKEVVKAVADLVRGNDLVTGNVTSGGTESILLAVKTARDHARATRPEVSAPEMIVPVSAHPAFHKAGHYLGVEPVVTEMDLSTYRADVDAVRRAVTDRTILVVGSAPTFSHGVVDPIPELAHLASEAGALMHVDGCVGAIPLSLMRVLGEPVPEFDFSVEGVSTISADLHKYGYAPKNSSVVLYRDAGLRRHAWFVNTSTTEYAILNPTVQSTRTGGPVAAAWALFQHLGLDGYLDLTRRLLAATRRMIDGVAAIDAIDVLGMPDMMMFTMASDAVNVFEVDDAMTRRGWSLLPEFACGGSPANLHVSVSPSNLGKEDQFLADLAAAVAEVEANPKIDQAFLAGEAAAAAGSTPMELFARLAPHAGFDGVNLPTEMGALNTILDLLPADARDELLTDFANLMW